MLFLVFLLIGIYASAAGSQDVLCGFGLDREEGATGQQHASFSFYQSGTVRPLILFGKLKDADDPFSLTQLEGRNENEVRSSADILDPTRVGSLAHYFHEMSYGALTLESNGDGVEGIWFETDSTEATDYGKEAPIHGRCSKAILEFAEEVFEAADADDTIDFSDYDRDGEDGNGDGVVDLVILYIPQEFRHEDLHCGFFGGRVIANSTLNYMTEDSVSIQDDMIVVFQRPSFPWLVGVTAHEYGHVMNLPELYDLQGDASAGIGLWGVMGWGPLGWPRNLDENLLSGPFSGPTPLSVWSRHKVGWITEDNGRLETVESDTDAAATLHDINSQSSAVKAYKIPIRGSDTEYFLMANRQNTYTEHSRGSYYDDLAEASGLAIWHIDDGLPIFGGSNLRNDNKNDNEKHKRVDLECADGLFSDQGYPSNNPDPVAGGDNLDYASLPVANNGNLGDATDLWDGSTGPPARTEFTPLSNPATHGYDGDRQSVFSGIAVQNISQSDKGVMSFDVRFIPSAPVVDVAATRQGTGDDWNTVTLEWSAPTVNATAIRNYQYSFDEREPKTWRGFKSWTEVSTGRFRGTIELAPDGDTVGYTFQVQAVTESGQASFPSFPVRFTLDRPGTVQLRSNRPDADGGLSIPTVGDQLTATLSDANGSLSGQRWQWERGRVSGDVWTGVPIANAPDAPSYMLTLDDVGQQVRATVSYMDGAGDNTDMAASDPTAVVVAGVVGLTTVEVAEVVLPATAPREVATYTATAAAGATVAWSLAGPDKDAFTVSDTGVLAFAQGPDYEAPTDAGHATDPDGNNVYHVTVQATVGEQTATAEVEVTVTNADDPGTVTVVPTPARADGSVSPPQVGEKLTATLTDPDGLVAVWQVVWRWERERSPGSATWSLVGYSTGAATSSYTPEAEAVGSQLRVQVSYQDGHSPPEGAPKMAQVSLAAVVGRLAWVEPLARTVAVAEVVLPATAAREVATYETTGVEGDAVAWSLAGPDASAFTVRGGVLTFAEGPDYEASTDQGHPTDADHNNVYHVRVMAQAGSQTVAVDVEVTVRNADDPGTVALTPAAPQVGTPVTAQLTDPDGRITGAEWVWEREGATPEDWIVVWPTDATGAAEAAELSSYTPQASDGGHRLRARVSYRDGQSADATDRKQAQQATAVAVQPRLQVAGPEAVDVAEVVVPATAAREVATYAATGADGAAVVWSLSGPDQAAFTLTDAGALAFAEGPDYEVPTDAGHATDPDGNNVYHVTVQATVGEQMGTAEVQVTVTNADDPGTVTVVPTPARADGSVSPPQVGEKLTATLTDPDGLAAVWQVVWRWERERSPGSATWSLVAYSTGAASSSYTPEAEAVGSQLRVQVSYQDGHSPPEGAPKTAQVSLAAVVGRLAWVEPLARTVEVAEVVLPATAAREVATYETTGVEGDAVAWSLSGPDQAAFTLEEGVLSFTEGPDYEAPADQGQDNEYHVTVEAQVGSQTVRREVEVTVTNADDPGTVTLSSLQPEVGDKLIATLTDEDGNVRNVRWSWSYFSAGADGSSDEVAGTSEGLSTTFEPRGVLVGIRLQARALYDDGHGTGKSAESVQTDPVIGPPGVPQALAAEAGDGQVVLNWQAPASDGGTPITGYDYRQSEDGGTTWQPAEPDWTDVGLTTTKTIEDLTNDTEYTFEVRARNKVGPGAVAQEMATPQATPLVITGLEEVSVDEVISSAAPLGTVATYTIAEVEADAITWSLGGVDAAAFGLTAGALTFVASPNYEAPTDQGRDNVYHVTVEAQVGPQTGTLPVTVTVQNADDPGTVTLSSLQPEVGEKLIATLTDEDGQVVVERWSWERQPEPFAAGASGLATGEYTPQAGEVGQYVRVTVYYRDGHAEGKQAQSVQTEAIIGPPGKPVLDAAAGDGQVVLSWQAPASDGGTPITGYDYRQSEDGGTTWEPDWTDVDLTTTKTIADLTNDTEYTFEVRARNKVGPGAAAQEMATPQATPLVITGLEEVSVDEVVSSAAPLGTVATYTIAEVEADAITWSLGGVDAAAFGLTAGALTFVASPNYEVPTDQGRDNVYHVTVEAQVGPQTGTLPVTVTVTNADDPGTVTLSSLQPEVGKKLIATLTDEDGQVVVERWAWLRQPESSDASGTAGLATGEYTPQAGEVGQYVQVTVYYRDGQGEGKQAQSEQTEAIIGVPGRLPTLSAESSDGQVVLHWQAPASDGGTPITGYEYRYQEMGASTWILDWTDVGLTTSQTVPGLKNGTIYAFEVRAVNKVGPGSEIQLLAASLAPCTLTLDGSAAITYAENDDEPVATYTATASDCGPLTWSLTGADASAFRLDGTGLSRTLRFNNPPNFEVQSTYAVAIDVSDGVFSEDVSVTVTITNEDDPGTVTLSSLQPQVGTKLIATLTDEDGQIVVERWSWLRSVESASAEGTSGLATGEYTPQAGEVGQYVQVTVYYRDGHGEDKEAQSEQTEAIIGPPGRPQALEAEAGDEQVELTWTAAADNGSPIQRYEYRQLSEPNWTPVSGGSSARSQTVGDLENGTEYTFEVRAVNEVGAGAPASVSATPEQPNQPPVITGPGTVSVDEGSTSVADYDATDPNGDAITWSKSGASELSIDDKGTLTFSSVPDFESGPNTYTVTVTATDSGDLSDSKTVTITIANVDEAGSVSLSTSQPRVGSSITATLKDPDGSLRNVDWSWLYFTAGAEGTEEVIETTTDEAVVDGASGQLTSSPLQISSVLAGRRVQMRALYTDGHGSSKEAESAKTDPVIGPPGKPGSLSASAGSGRATLSWTAAADNGSSIQYYQYRPSGGTWATVSGGASARSQTVTDLSSCTSYTFEVRAVNGEGNGSAASASTTLSGSPPPTPSLSASGGNGQVTLSWSAPAVDSCVPIQYYEYRPSGGTWATVSGGSSARSQTVTGLSNGTEYTFEVRAVNDAGTGSAASASATPEQPNRPPVITGPSTVSVDEGSTSVADYDATDPDGDSITWSKSGSSALSISSSGTLSFSSAPDFESGPNTYTVTVTAKDTGGLSDSETVTITINNIDEAGSVSLSTSQPRVGSSITATLKDPDGSLRNVRWRWSYFTAGAEGTEEEIETITDEAPVDGASGQLTSSPLQISSVLAGLRLQMRVFYTDGHGSNKQATSAKTDPVIGPPGRPGSLSASAGSRRATLSWTAAADNGSSIQYYQYRRSGGTWATVSGGASARSQTVTGLSSCTSYTFEVRAVNGEGNGSAASASTTLSGSSPGQPSLSASGGNGQVTLSWSAPTVDSCVPIQYYQYRRSGGTWSTVSGGSSARSQTVTGLSNGTTYTFEVRAVNDAGTGSAASASATPEQPNRPPVITGPSTVSVDEGSRSVADYDASDPDGDSITWSKSGSSALSISSRGTLTFSSAPDFESGSNTYTVTVKATDSGGLSDSKTVTITIANVDEAGSVSLSTSQPKVGSSIRATLKDADGSLRNVRWRWSYFTAGAEGTEEEIETITDEAPVDGASGQLTSSPLQISSVLAGLRLQMRVFYTDGHGSNKQATSAKTDPVIGPPGAPGNLSASANRGRATLSWTAASDNGSSITRYEYRYRRSGTSSWSGWTSVGKVTSYTVSNLSGGASFTFQVRAVNAVGTGPSAETSSVVGAADDEGTADGDTSDGDTSDGDTADGDTSDEGTSDGDTADADTSDEGTADADTPDEAAAKSIGLTTPADAVLAASAAPNPFNPTTTLHLQLPDSGPVRLTIYNIAGQVVRTLVDGLLEAGYHRLEWDGRDQQGHPVTSGVYLYRVRTTQQILVGKMALIR